MYNKPQKIIMLGQSCNASSYQTDVGKTALLQTFINKKFPDKTSVTQGSSFHRHNYVDGDGQQIVMDLWDTAGQEKYRSLLTLYYKNSDGVIITFDLSNESTFEAVKYWNKQLQQNCEFPPCVILVGNKSDIAQPGKGVSDKAINKFLVVKKDWKYIQCSAKQNKNVTKIFQTIGSMVKKADKRKKQSKIKERYSKDTRKRLAIGSSLNAGKDKGCC